MELSFKNRRRLATLKASAKRSLPPLPEKDSFAAPFVEMKNKVLRFWHSLNTPQRLYLTPTLIVISLFFAGIDFEFSTLAFISLLVVVGLSLEFWPKFLRLWDSLLGKTLILTFYAVLANFALASSGGLVNEVTGVSADALPYSHNVSLMLHVPSWFLLTTILSLLSISLLMPIYLIFLLIIKPFGIHGLWHPPHYKYVFSTALIRYVWVWILLAVIATYASRAGFINQSTPIVGHVIEGFVHGDEVKNNIQKQDGSTTPEVSEVNEISEAESTISEADTNHLSTSTPATGNLDTDDIIAEVNRRSDEPLTEQQEAAIRFPLVKPATR